MDLMLELDNYQEIYQKAYGYEIHYELVDKDDNPIDITGNTSVKFYASSATDELVKYSGNMVVDNAALGLVHFSPLVTDFITSGKFDVEIWVNFAAKRLIFGKIILMCLKSRGS
jgi:hypothetical protein